MYSSCTGRCARALARLAQEVQPAPVLQRIIMFMSQQLNAAALCMSRVMRHRLAAATSLTTTSDVASRAPTSTLRALCSMADQTTVKDTAEAVTICLVAPGGLPGFAGLPCPANLSATNTGTDDTTFTACAVMRRWRRTHSIEIGLLCSSRGCELCCCGHVCLVVVCSDTCAMQRSFDCTSYDDKQTEVDNRAGREFVLSVARRPCVATSKS